MISTQDTAGERKRVEEDVLAELDPARKAGELTQAELEQRRQERTGQGVRHNRSEPGRVTG